MHILPCLLYTSITFVYGKGKKKTEIQQLYEELEICGERLMGYKECFEIMGKDVYKRQAEDKEYKNIFSDQLTAEHIIFVYSLGRAIDEFKINLNNKKEQRTDIENDELNFLSKRGSKMLLISAVSTCMESLLGKKILDSWRLVFKYNKNFDSLDNM